MTSVEQQARDLLDRARQVLEAIPPDEEWIQVGLGNIHANPVGSQPPRAKTWSSRIGDLVAEAPTLIRDLADRLEFMEHEFEVERDGRNEHFDARMDAEAEARDLAAELSRLRAQETRIRAHIARVNYRNVPHSPRCRCADCPPQCDCPLDPHHRWNCPLTPIWAQTIRGLDCNPWKVFRP